MTTQEFIKAFNATVEKEGKDATLQDIFIIMFLDNDEFKESVLKTFLATRIFANDKTKEFMDEPIRDTDVLREAIKNEEKE